MHLYYFVCARVEIIHPLKWSNAIIERSRRQRIFTIFLGFLKHAILENSLGILTIILLSERTEASYGPRRTRFFSFAIFITNRIWISSIFNYFYLVFVYTII